MAPGVRHVGCPRCGAPVAWTPASAFRPFCSERCKTVDLGAWATERYRFAAVEQDDADERARDAPDAPPAPPQ